ncbi:hypothetical protein L596_020475 [Steinernema carpocapsae]|uniref:Uncharacterized protein n=1 Tax=Steinernema carpocapsae TaxID=34508 RepID=A0A4U5MTM4_STECR|nr:hypothetical protein L596_020475 [Steinernema carpocapsae]
MDPNSQLPSTSSQVPDLSPLSTRVQIDDEYHGASSNFHCLHKFYPKKPVRPSHIILAFFIIILGSITAGGVIAMVVVMAKEGSLSSFMHIKKS